MEAKDTVIKSEDIQDLWIPCETCHREPFWKTGEGTTECMECIAVKHREAQAEITFRAGIEEAQRRLHSEEVREITEEALAEQRLAGRKDVVELLMTTVDYECEDENGSPTISFWFSPEDWEVKLKDWGIDG